MDDEHDDPHYGPTTTDANGVHACDDGACMTRGLHGRDLAQLGYALRVLGSELEDTALGVTVFRDADGLYVLLTAAWPMPDNPNAKTVVGAVYTPHLLDDLRAKGYTTTLSEAEAGVN